MAKEDNGGETVEIEREAETRGRGGREKDETKGARSRGFSRKCERLFQGRRGGG